MERAASIIAALEAGKLPSQEQSSRLIDYIQLQFLTAAPLPQVAPDEHEEGTEKHNAEGGLGLSRNGVALAQCLRDLLEAYKQLGEHKNDDNILQRTIWHISQASKASETFNSPYSLSFSSTASTSSSPQAHEFTTSIYPPASLSSDLSALQTSLSSLFQVLWSSTIEAGASNVWNDLSSFLRLSLADTVERVEVEVAKAKQGLRDVNGEPTSSKGKNKDEAEAEVEVRKVREEPKEGEEYIVDDDDGASSDEDDDEFEDARDQFEFGLNIATEALQAQVNKAAGWDEGVEQEDDAVAKLKRAMDALRDASSAVFDTSRSAKRMAFQLSSDATARLLDAYHDMCDRALEDEHYRSDLETLFSICQRWLTRSLNTLDAQLQRPATLGDLIDDPTPERHITQALNLLVTLLERFCAGASLSELLEALRSVALDVREDEDLKAWFDELFTFARKSLSEQGYARSEDAQAKREDLSVRLRALRNEDSDIKRKWSRDVERLKNEVAKLEGAFTEDEDLRRMREACRQLMSRDDGRQDMKDSLMEHVSWFWVDLLKVYLPKLMELVKDIPIPRTEYKDEHVEFVFENLNITTMSFLPAHTFVQNVTDLDLETPREADSESTTKLGTSTHIKTQAVELALSDLSFWCLDKGTTFTVSGLVGMDVPPKGVDVDIQLKLIQDEKQRRESGHFHTLEQCNVHISKKATLSIKKSNHSILFTLFRGTLVNRLRDAIEKALTAQLQSAVMAADGVAYDVERRREKLKGDGVDEGTALAMAVWAQFGKLKCDVKQVKEEEKAKTTLSATGTGVVLQSAKQGEEGRAIAIGIEPQILGGEKRGPMGVASEKIEGNIFSSLKEDVKADVQEAGENAKEAVRQTKSFGLTVEVGRLEEETRFGWESDAFDV